MEGSRSCLQAVHVMRNKKSLFILLLIALCVAFTTAVFAQEATPTLAPNPLGNVGVSEGGNAPPLISQMAVLAGLAILPYAIMLLSSYVKIVIVLSLLRNALGVQQSPPNAVLTGIALLMTVYVMFPTGVAMYNASEDYIKKEAPTELVSAPTAAFIMGIADRAKEPLKQFLERNTTPKHIQSFYQLAYKSFPEGYKESLKPTDFIIVLPSFITSQLKAAFEIGVLIYLPFFVIDLVTSNILLAMGMMMLSPLTIALPLKLLLLVMVDGWTLIIQGLVMTFR